MALSANAVRNLACCNCRKWVLRSFISSIGGPSHQQTKSKPQRRTFSTPARRWNESREPIQAVEEKDHHPLNEINEITTGEDALEAVSAAEEGPIDVEQPEKAEAHVPWYLQVDSPIQQQDTPRSAAQNLPEIPIHPPALLEPLLGRVSVELGMDHLSLLDLRELDPPPALGANLLMIIGTARSERHLHVSADRLCRWLRTEHGLTPFADGLLGRQELKVKLRRRAKKSRLLSAVGAKSTADTELYEGIRTGWVCVNVGRVEDGDLPKTDAQLEAEKNIVGFGTRTKGAHLVVQLMTEEKRGEIDLEKLWIGLLNRSRQAKDELTKKEDEATRAEVEAKPQSDGSTASNAAKPRGESSAYTPPSYVSEQGSIVQQARAFHTSARQNTSHGRLRG